MLGFSEKTVFHGVISYFVGLNLYQRLNATRIYLLVAKIKQKNGNMCCNSRISNVSFPEEPSLKCMIRAVRILCCQMSAASGDI